MNATENVMSVKQTLKCGIHSPEKWQDDYNGYGADDISNLPNLAPVKVYAVDEYPACPDNWEHGSDIAGSYFVGLAEDGALWLDFNECFDHTHDVAVVLSVQGINPITGQTMVGDNPLRMEQYHKKCPIHGTEFKQDYFCDDCGFSWPGQNYVSTTGTPFGMFWLDGFRTPDGNVRQYIITAEKMRGIAAQVMKNSEDRVFAIGVAFYLSKDKKPEMPKGTPRPSQVISGGGGVTGTQPMFFSPMHTPQPWNKGRFASPPAYMGYPSSVSSSAGSSNSIGSLGGQHTNSVLRSTTKGKLTAQNLSVEDQLRGVAEDQTIVTHHAFDVDAGAENIISAALDADGGDELAASMAEPIRNSLSYEDDDLGAVDSLEVLDTFEHIETVTPVKKLEVGAGALVSQRVYDDPKNLKKYWEETPAGMIYINYCDVETLKRILDGGKKATKKDGFLNGVQVG